VAPCRQKRRTRFTIAANLVNESVEARQLNAVKRLLARLLRYDVIVLPTGCLKGEACHEMKAELGLARGAVR